LAYSNCFSKRLLLVFNIAHIYAKIFYKAFYLPK